MVFTEDTSYKFIGKTESDVPIFYRQIVGTYIVTNNKYILLGMNKQGGDYPGQFIVPAGGAMEGEKLIEALYRECLEETSIDIKKYNCEQFCTTKNERYQNSHGICIADFYYYLVKATCNHDRIHPKAKDDLGMIFWIKINNLKNIANRINAPTLGALKLLKFL